MRWQGRRASTNAEDRRGFSAETVLVVGNGSVDLVLLGCPHGADTMHVQNIGRDSVGQQKVEYHGKADTKERAAFYFVVPAGSGNVCSALYRRNGRLRRSPELLPYNDARMWK